MNGRSYTEVATAATVARRDDNCSPRVAKSHRPRFARAAVMAAVLVCHATDPHRGLGRRTQTQLGITTANVRPLDQAGCPACRLSRLGRIPAFGRRSASFFPGPSAQLCSPVFLKACNERETLCRKIHSSPWHSAASTARKSPPRRTACYLLVHGDNAFERAACED